MVSALLFHGGREPRGEGKKIWPYNVCSCCSLVDAELLWEQVARLKRRFYARQVS